MSSTPQPSLAAVYRERAACMVSWNAKLSLAIAMRNAWATLDLEKYPVGSISRAEKAMELVTQTVSDTPFLSVLSHANIIPPEPFTGLA